MTKSKEKRQANTEVIRLIEETESAKQTAHVNEVFLKNITRVLPQYVFWKDIHSVYLGCNKNYANLVGLGSPEEIVGKTDHDLNWQPVGHTADTFQRGDQDTVSGYPITNQEEILALPNDKILITLVSKLPIIDNGKVIGIVGYFTDISELKNKEKELIKAKKQAEAANKAKTEFLMNMSHDFRTPASGIYCMAKLVSKKITDPSVLKLQNLVVNSSAQLLSLLEDVLDYSRIDSDQVKLTFEKVNINSLIQDVVSFLAPKAEEKSLELNIMLPATSVYYHSDKIILHRIILNLVTNAIKFTDQGSVLVSLKQKQTKTNNNTLIIEIKDTGIGIEKKYHQSIFETFFRVEHADTKKYPGVGLGLSNVNLLLKKLGGKITLKSSLGKGSSFTVYL